MGYNIFLINENKKELLRVKTNGEDSDFVVKYLSDNQGETIKILGEDSDYLCDIIYDYNLKGYKEIKNKIKT